jgi:hypothetical protein
MILTSHAEDEMAADNIGKPHILAALIHGEKTPTRYGRSKYRLNDIVVITAYSEQEADEIVVTAWVDRGYTEGKA